MTKEPTLFDTPFNKALRSVRKYDPSQARDQNGRWTAGGVARAVGGALAGGAALAGAAAMGHPLGRKLLPGIRRAVIGARTRAAQRASKPGAVVGRADPAFRPHRRDDLRDTGTLLTGGSSAGNFVGAVGRQVRRDVGHTARSTMAAARGALTARGRESMGVNATRHQLNQFSAAANRRRGVVAGVNHPTKG